LCDIARATCPIFFNHPKKNRILAVTTRMLPSVVVGIKYVTDAAYDDTKQCGDFRTMFFDMNLHARDCFIFNDNVAHSRRSHSGAGTAFLRAYNTASSALSASPCRVIGIPTGWSPETPFSRMTPSIRRIIDLAFERAEHVVATTQPLRIFFASDACGLIGTGTFGDRVGRDVLRYITSEMHRRLTIPICKDSLRSLPTIMAEEAELSQSLNPSGVSNACGAGSRLSGAKRSEHVVSGPATAKRICVTIVYAAGTLFPRRRTFTQSILKFGKQRSASSDDAKNDHA
jgi:hypothetical protein